MKFDFDDFRVKPLTLKITFKESILLPSLKSPRKAIARLIMGKKLWNENICFHSCLFFKDTDSPTKFLMTKREVTTHEHFATFRILNYVLRLKKIVEIGVQLGNSTIPLLESAIENDGFVTSIDIKPCIEAKQRIKQLGYNTRWKFIQSDSLKVNWNEQIDHLFIDGEHTYEQVFKELEKFEPFVREQGIITLHDIVSEPVQSAISDYIRDKNNLKYFQYYNSYGLGVIYKTGSTVK